MTLSNEDINDIKQGMYEVYEELFSHTIEFLQYDKVRNTTDGEVYEERKYKYFLAPVLLVGRAKVTTSNEELTPSGVSRDSDATFTLPLVSLEKASILELEEELILNSYMKYKGITYKIVDFQPESNIADNYLKYTVKGKKITDEYLITEGAVQDESYTAGVEEHE